MNILFAFADDWGRYASAYAGRPGASPWNQLIKTPNFDRVAAEGALLTNAFIQAPTCTPCRSSILSGRFFWQTGLGAILRGAVWDDSIPTYPLELEKAGWHIGHTYKVWSPGKTANAPYGGSRTAYNPAGQRYANFSHEATKRVPEVGVAQAKAELLEETRQNFDAFLAARPEGAPFCYWWGPTNTHRTWEPGSGHALWGLNPDDLEGRMPEFLPDVPVVREDVADYLGECQAVDAGLGVILGRLEAEGELDDTLIVVSGDHGIPGIPRAKCNLYDIGCEVALAVRWPGRVQPGRVVDDFVSLMDLAPTFLEAAGLSAHPDMAGRSLLPVLESPDSGQIDEQRDHVITGRERHVDTARAGELPYPQRAIRTQDYLYILNFEPDRWPMGDPQGLDDLSQIPPSFSDLQWVTRPAYADFDASPTKAWMIHHRSERSVRPLFELAFGKRPYAELYDLRVDPHYMQNEAGSPQYADTQQELHQKLMAALTEASDPRVVERPCRFEEPPYAGPLAPFQI